jgi:two-component system secretion response regulator SsrB
MRILLADDQPQVRSALRLLLEHVQVCIVSDVENLAGLLCESPEPTPDAILIDWELPGLSPADGLSRVRQIYPSARIVALSSRPEARHSALHAGADVFVCKGDPPEVLLAALQRKER